MLLKPKIRPFS